MLWLTNKKIDFCYSHLTKGRCIDIGEYIGTFCQYKSTHAKQHETHHTGVKMNVKSKVRKMDTLFEVRLHIFV